jgi:hypothetical protein
MEAEIRSKEETREEYGIRKRLVGARERRKRDTESDNRSDRSKKDDSKEQVTPI